MHSAFELHLDGHVAMLGKAMHFTIESGHGSENRRCELRINQRKVVGSTDR
jgi:hypothetical protein